VLKKQVLRQIAEARLTDAQQLFQAQRYDGAVYLCGYAIEIALKARICDTLNWPEFPEKNNEFKDLASFRTHNLDILLRLSGLEAQIKQTHMGDWSIVMTWDPEARYQPVGHVDSARAQSMIDSVKNLLEVL